MHFLDDDAVSSQREPLAVWWFRFLTRPFFSETHVFACFSLRCTVLHLALLSLLTVAKQHAVSQTASRACTETRRHLVVLGPTATNQLVEDRTIPFVGLLA
jgi:hypothetical protein